MSDSDIVDIEAGLSSEESIQGATLVDDDTFDVGATESELGLSPGNSEDAGAAAEGLCFGGGASEKTPKLYSTRPGEKQTDVILEGWTGSAEDILFFVGLFSTTASLFVIESYKVSPDAVDQAFALFDQVSRLVGVPADTPEPSQLWSPLGLVPTSFEPSSSVGLAITLWLLSLSLNIMTCVLWVLWQQWWQQSIQTSSQGGVTHTHARVRVGLLAMGHIVDVVWVLLCTSTLLFLVGLGDFILPINTTAPRAFLGCLGFSALLYAAKTLLPYRFPGLYLTHSPNPA